MNKLLELTKLQLLTVTWFMRWCQTYDIKVFYKYMKKSEKWKDVCIDETILLTINELKLDLDEPKAYMDKQSWFVKLLYRLLKKYERTE